MRKKVLIVLGILLLVSITMGISYASWVFSETQKDFNTLGSKCFEISMVNESESITINKAYPISDEEGLKEEGYTFTIKNTCNTYAAYEVNLEDMILSEKRLPSEYIKVSVDNGRPISLKEIEKQAGNIEGSDSSYKLTSGSLAPEEETTYNIKMWMDEETPAIEEVMNASFVSKVSISAGYIKEEEIANELSLKVESKTPNINNEAEEFAIEGISVKHNIIEYSLDNKTWNRIEEKGKEVNFNITITKEGTYTIYIKDEMGNVESQEFTTNKLDQTAPNIIINEQNKQESIELTIEITDKNNIEYGITEKKEEPSEWNKYENKITYEISENKTYYIWAKDAGGNVSYKEYVASTIDKKAPELEVSSTITEWGEKDYITIKASDDVIGITGYSISKIEGEYNWVEVDNTLKYETKIELTENGTYYVSVKDAYNHITTKSIVIEKIDNILPIVEGLSASTTWSKTNTITGIIKDDESGLEGYKITKEEIEPTEFIQIEGKEYNFTEEVTENSTYYIWVKDVKGNINKSSIEVSYVDNTPPILSSIQNSSNGSWAKEVTLSWEIEETGSGIAKVEWQLNDNGSWGSFGESEWYGITRRNNRNDKISIRITDKAGNVSNIESSVLKIDNTGPSKPTITNSKNNVWSTGDVTVSLSSSDSGSGIARFEWYENGAWTTRAINQNGNTANITYTADRNATIRFRVVDKVGNVSSENTTIVKIDKTNPTAKISATVKQNNITVSASGSSDSGSGIKNYQYRLDNGQWYSSTSTSYTFSNVSVGSHTVYVQVVDNAGRTSSAVNAKGTIASDNIIFDGGAKYNYQIFKPSGTVRVSTSYIYFNNDSNKTLSFTTLFANNYRYLKVTARASKNSNYGTYYLARFGIQSQPTASNIGIVTNVLKNYDLINYSNKTSNITSYTTFTLDLNGINSSYYVYLNNCDTTFYIQKVWLTNTA